MPKTLGSPAFHTSPHQSSPTLPSTPSHYTCFLFLLSHRTNIPFYLPFFPTQPTVQVQTPSTALTSRTRSCPHYNTRFPLKSEYRTFLDYIAVQDCRRLQYFPSFLYPYSPIVRSILVRIATYKYHRPAPHRIIRSSRQPRPPFYLSRVQLLSFSFPVRSTPNRHHPLSTDGATRERVNPYVSTSYRYLALPRPSRVEHTHRRSHD